MLLSIACFAGTTARAEENVNTLKFSNPDKPGTVKIVIARGDIRLRGSDDSAVTVKSDAKPPTPQKRKDGLRELTAPSAFSLTEKDNIITLEARRHSADFEITLPRQSNIVIANSWDGDVSCTGISGDIEIKNTNGRVRLDGISGSALIETTNGEISATIRELREGKPLSFTSMNGEIVVRVPADAKANVRLRSRNGAILTDFDEKDLITKIESLPGGNRSSDIAAAREDIHQAVREAVREGLEVAREAAEAAREVAEAVREGVHEATGKSGHLPPMPRMPPKPPLPPMTGGKIVAGTLNGGGTDIQIATMNGEVVLRKAADKK